jgi:hypothetical protein
MGIFYAAGYECRRYVWTPDVEGIWCCRLARKWGILVDQVSVTIMFNNVSRGVKPVSGSLVNLPEQKKAKS